MLMIICVVISTLDSKLPDDVPWLKIKMKNLSLGVMVFYQMFCCSLTTVYNQDQDAFNEIQAAVMKLVPFLLTAAASVCRSALLHTKDGQRELTFGREPGVHVWKGWP